MTASDARDLAVAALERLQSDGTADPLSRLTRAVDLGSAAAAVVREAALQARGDGRSWAEVAAGLGALDERGEADPARAYALLTARSSSAELAWTCSCCSMLVTDAGPAAGSPRQAEPGHATDCTQLEGAQQRWERLGHQLPDPESQKQQRREQFDKVVGEATLALRNGRLWLDRALAARDDPDAREAFLAAARQAVDAGQQRNQRLVELAGPTPYAEPLASEALKVMDQGMQRLTDARFGSYGPDGRLQRDAMLDARALLRTAADQLDELQVEVRDRVQPIRPVLELVTDFTP